MGLGEYSTEGGRWSGCARDRASHRAALCLVARRFQSRSTAKLTNSGARVGPSIAARRGCPRIRFKLVRSPCKSAPLMDCRHELTSLLSDRRREYPHHTQNITMWSTLQPVLACEFGEPSGRGLLAPSNSRVLVRRCWVARQGQYRRHGIRDRRCM